MDFRTSGYNGRMTLWSSAKNIPALKRLRQERLELNEEMRRSRLPVAHSYLVPTFPTEPERKLRLVLNDQREALLALSTQ